MAGPIPDPKPPTPRYSRPPTAATSPRRMQQPSPHLPVYHQHSKISTGAGVSVTGAASGSAMMRGGRNERGGDGGGVKSNYFN
jgi:hypothetical protein